MKVCTICKVGKDESEFCKDNAKKDGLRTFCRKCDAQRRKEYSESHPEDQSRNIKRLEEWGKKNKDRVVEAKKKWVENNNSRINSNKRAWRKNNHDKEAAQQFKDGLKLKYGLSLDQHQDIVNKQGNRCAICNHEMVDGRKGRYCRNTDHSHSTGKVRGILCNCCNKVIGYAYDDITVLENAIKYLNFHSRQDVL